jgi:hypothetical protein
MATATPSLFRGRAQRPPHTEAERLREHFIV